VKLENSFEVAAPPDQVWELFMDVPRMVPCMPGAELTETIDESSWKALMHVKLGPIALNFDTDLTREEADEAAHRARLGAKARELRGRGVAQATIESSLEAVDGGSRVAIVTDLTLSGAVAQYGRGLVQDVSAQLVSSFAECLKAQLTATPQVAQAAVASQAKPVAGLGLFFGAIRRRIARLFGRSG
jgi:uncharacterized protein